MSPIKKHCMICLIGFISGFTLMITGGTLNFWLAIENIDIRTIGIFAAVTLPYAFNFIWAPVFDAIKLPLLNKYFSQRLSWIIVIQVFLSIAIYIMSSFNPKNEAFSIAIIAILVAFLSSSQDAVLGGIKTEIIKKEEQVALSGIYVLGYRIGMVISGSGAIMLSDYINWSIIYKICSISVLIFPIILILTLKNAINVETTLNNDFYNKNSIFKHFLSKIKCYKTMKYIIIILLFLILYRLSDNFISAMISPFLVHIGYTTITIATVGKLFGTISALIGGIFGSYIARKSNILNSLLLFGIIHAVTHSLFIIQGIYGENIYLLFTVMGFENITNGIAMSLYIAFIAMLCDGKFRATKYAFFSSMMGISRSILPAISGYIIANLGWQQFFLFTMIATIPSFIIILYIKKHYKKTFENIT